MSKLFTSVYFDNAASIESLSATVDKAIQNGATSLFIFLAEASPFNPKRLDQYLQKIPHQIDCSKNNLFIAAAAVVKQRQDCTLSMDCISRCLFLEDKLGKKLRSIFSNLPKNATLVGVLTLEKISNSSCKPIQFSNKATMPCGFEEIESNE